MIQFRPAGGINESGWVHPQCSYMKFRPESINMHDFLHNRDWKA